MKNLTISVRGNHYTFLEDNKHEFYFFHKNRCKTESQLIDWLCHLNGKNWFTERLAYELKEKFYQENNKYPHKLGFNT